MQIKVEAATTTAAAAAAAAPQDSQLHREEFYPLSQARSPDHTASEPELRRDFKHVAQW
jgi:hypothetical protein